ncbi:MAG: VOC family protein [Desulfovibrio sp.]|jgi:hypothetical protein|nr:VOC family protein [Desulfovibrio sp.]
MPSDSSGPSEGPGPARADSRLYPDHLVINVKYAMAGYEQIFQELGFALTPRSVHSLGSVNRLAVFADGYLELIGLPPDAATPRKDVLESYTGIDGLVFAMEDPDALQARLTGQGFTFQAVQRFSRPVQIDGVQQLAEFETVRLTPGQFREGRVYFCRHLTPQLVRRGEWMRHPNTAAALGGISIASSDPETTAERYAALGESVLPISVYAVPEAEERFGVPLPPDRFVAVSVRCDNPRIAAGFAQQCGRDYAWRNGALLVPLAELDAVLEFTA